MEEKVILVDIDDKPIGIIEKIEAHEKALLHRAVSAFMFNSERKMLLQQRAVNKYHSPGLWTNTVCTHPHPGESNKEAIVRRLYQEMGLREIDVKKLFHFTYKEKFDNGLTEYEFDHVYFGFSNNLPVPEPKEVVDYKYVEIDEVLELIKETPQDFTVWFKKIVERVVFEVKSSLVY